MRESGIRDDAAPWSFFLPVTLAVIVGVVAAGLIQRGIDRVFGNAGDAAASAAAPAQAESQASPPPSSDTADGGEAARSGAAPAVPDAAETPVAMPPEAPPPPVQPREPDTDTAVPELPGAILARRDGAPEACIHGTIALRDENGWQQRLENDAPVPCTEQSTVP